MTIWSCKGRASTRLSAVILGGVMAFALSACSEDGGLAGLNLLPAGGQSAQHAPLVKAQLMRGALTIAPPDGFCIDPTSLRQDFALLARCDILGGKSGALDATLGIITVSAVAQTEGQDPISLKALAHSQDNGLEIVDVFTEEHGGGRYEIARARGKARAKGLGEQHWRAITALNNHDLSIALFAQSESPTLGRTGRKMLRSLVTRSHDATLANVIVSQTQPKPVKKGLAATLSGLFN